MDRYLLSGAMLLLTFEVTWLMNDLRIVDLPFFGRQEISSSSTPIGKVLTSTQDLRRRGLNSILWEDSRANDTLFLYDTVLTLEKSNATIQLKENSEIFLSENTLIVLEPFDTKSPDVLRVKFNRGQLHSRNVASNTVISAPSWTMAVEKGAEIKLRSMPGEKLEVELLKGKVQLQGLKENLTFDNEQVILLHKESAESVPITGKISWNTGTDNTYRVYGNSFPKLTWLAWSGNAARLRLTDATQDVSVYPLNTGQNQFPLQLKPGTYQVRLEGDNEVSPTLSIQVFKAPSLHLLSPRPRDRFVTDTDILFTWLSSAVVPNYKLEIATDPEFTSVVTSQNSSVTSTTLKMPPKGNYYWRVQGVDDLGFVIPSSDSSPIFSVKKPLAAPKLKVPETRAPAKDDSASRFIKFLNYVAGLLIPRAEAKESSFEAVFQWEEVDGAEHYYIEIDVRPDFQNPILVQKVRFPVYVWTKPKIGTYYWRVAAGSDDNMGLFSEAAKVQLTAPSKNPLSVAPGVQVRRAKPEPVPPVPVVQHLEPTPEPAPTPPPPLPANPTRARISYGMGYEYSVIAGETNSTAMYSGLVPLVLNLNAEFPMGEFSSLFVDTTYQRALWKPKSVTELPFQQQVIDSSVRFHAHYRSRPDGLHFGLMGSQFSQVKRVSLESVSLEPTSTFGPAFGFEWTQFETLVFSHLFGLGFGNGAYDLASENRLSRRIDLNSRVGLILGGSMNLIIQRHADGSNFKFQFGLSGGLEW